MQAICTIKSRLTNSSTCTHHRLKIGDVDLDSVAERAEAPEPGLRSVCRVDDLFKLDLAAADGTEPRRQVA